MLSLAIALNDSSNISTSFGPAYRKHTRRSKGCGKTRREDSASVGYYRATQSFHSRETVDRFSCAGRSLRLYTTYTY